VADMPEILVEIDLGLKEVARKLRRYLSRHPKSCPPPLSHR